MQPFNLGAQRHSGKFPSSDASADRWGMKAQPRTIVKITSKLYKLPFNEMIYLFKMYDM